jgi:hypothetical protein
MKNYLKQNNKNHIEHKDDGLYQSYNRKQSKWVQNP